MRLDINSLFYIVCIGGRHIILGIALTGLHGQLRRNNPRELIFRAKGSKHCRVLERSGFLRILAIFSFAGRIHDMLESLENTVAES